MVSKTIYVDAYTCASGFFRIQSTWRCYQCPCDPHTQNCTLATGGCIVNTSDTSNPSNETNENNSDNTTNNSNQHNHTINMTNDNGSSTDQPTNFSSINGANISQ
jgi:hypothetical protein